MKTKEAVITIICTAIGCGVWDLAPWSTYQRQKHEIVRLNSDITALKKSQSNLAAGLLDLHQKDEYVQEVMNETNEK